MNSDFEASSWECLDRSMSIKSANMLVQQKLIKRADLQRLLHKLPLQHSLLRAVKAVIQDEYAELLVLCTMGRHLD